MNEYTTAAVPHRMTADERYIRFVTPAAETASIFTSWYAD